MGRWSLLLLLLILVEPLLAKEVVVNCVSKQGYPSIELTADDSILSKAGSQKAQLKGLKKSVVVETEISAGAKSLQLTITSSTGNKTVLIQVQDAEDASSAWDGAGTTAYGPAQAGADYKKLFGGEAKEKKGLPAKIMIVQNFSKGARYPKTGGFCFIEGR